MVMNMKENTYKTDPLLFDTDGDTLSDGDGLPDILETQGMRAINGRVYYSNPYVVDSDNDGVYDGEEMGIPAGADYKDHTLIEEVYIGGGEYKYHIIFDAVCDPMNADSDGDGILDNADPRMLNKYNNGTIIKNFDKDREKVKILQMCLEYLGYLEMPIENGIKTNYGTFGGVTYSAVQLFQLNYGFSPLSDDLNNEMDSMTFATIINVAVNQGLIRDDISTNSTDKEGLYNDYCNHVELNGCKKYSVSIYNNPPPINNKEKSAGVTNVKLNSIYYYDYTKPINNLLESHVYECQCMANINNTIKFIWFINKVDHEKEWDIKRDNRWNEQFEIYGINYKSAAFKFYYNGILITPECLGNITYGYWGTAANIEPTMLLLGGDVASLTSGIQHGEVGIDSWEDKEFILLGVSLYHEQRA